ncbi:hypothetical protein D3C86_1279570 [compost metagenome]
MEPMQEINFHFADGRVAFSHLRQHPDLSWFAEQTLLLAEGSSGHGQFYPQVPCPAGATADQAFAELVERAEFRAKEAMTTLSAVNNPNNDEFVKIPSQKLMAPGVEIRLNGEPV